MTKRVVLCSAIFLSGAIIGLECGWIFGFNKGVGNRRDTHAVRNGIIVTFSATIDGSDHFIFTRDSVWNEHGQWQPPRNVLFNSEPWEDLTQPPPRWFELTKDLDLSGARIVTRKGRDLIALETTAEGFDLYVVDSPMGAAQYVVEISIPRK